MNRVHNFAAGPAALPLEVLEQAQAELLDLDGIGMSVMEISHRSPKYQSIISTAEEDFRKLLNIPDNYKVLFLQGGASLQFDMIPMNLMHKSNKAIYLNTGNFAKKAIKEAKLFGEVIVPASSEDINYAELPAIDSSKFPADADYFHFTYNNTIYGTEFKEVPAVPAGIPVVSDMTSCILSEPIDWSKFDMVYAGAQKNVGPAGLTVVIIKDSLIGLKDKMPAMLNYKSFADNGSLYNTPPTFAIYVAGLVFKWMLKNGGVEAFYEMNKKKAAMLYDYLDNESKMFKGIVTNKADRSIMSVTFKTESSELDKKFCDEATKNGICNIKGHRVAGGMRASIYNPVTLDSVKALVDFMKKFEQENA